MLAEAAPPTTGSGEGVRDTGWLLPVGAVCMSLAIFLFGVTLLSPRRGRRRIARLGSVHAAVHTTTALSDLTGRAATAIEGALDRNGRRGGLDARLEQAGISLRAGEFVVLAGAGALITSVLGLLLSGPTAGLLLGAFSGFAANGVLSVLRTRRRRMFADQLSDTLQLLAGSMRAGHGLLQAIDALGREAPEPTNSEFRRLVVETRLGRDLSESLNAMAQRLGTEDFEWVVQAIDINREVGGDLAEVLDTVGATIRERNQVMRQVKSLTAEGRLSAYILIALPFALALAMQVMNPDYLQLLTYGPGLVMSAAGLVMLGLGALWFRALCRLDY